MNANREAEKFIYATLSVDASLIAAGSTGVYREVAPASAVYPFVVFYPAGGSILRGVGTARVWDDLLYSVHAVGDPATSDKVDGMATAIRSALDCKTGTTTTARIVSCVEETPYADTDYDGDKAYPKMGGDYRLKVQSL